MKYDIPEFYYDEVNKFNELSFKTTYAPNPGTWTSISSGISYFYTNEADLLSQLRAILDSYIVTSSDYNNLVDNKYLKLTNCVNCGAPLKNNICEYCSTNHNINFNASINKNINTIINTSTDMRSFIEQCQRKIRIK